LSDFPALAVDDDPRFLEQFGEILIAALAIGALHLVGDIVGQQRLVQRDGRTCGAH